MQASEQGVREPGKYRYQVIPRTLIFVTTHHPTTGAQEVLLIRGAPSKRLWANQYNGLGGHIEAHENVLNAAGRELREEAGLAVESLTLRGVVNIDTGADELGQRPGVMMFVFHATSQSRAVHGTSEGMPEWIPVSALGDYPLVDDLFEVIPRTLGTGPTFFGHYRPAADGTMHYHFEQG